MTDGDYIYRAILAHPDEDTPRLAYADWLDENGQPDRAEFIRVQVELAGWKPYVAPPEILEIATSGRMYARMAAEQIADDARKHADRKTDLRLRERELFDANLCRWESGRVIPDCAYRIPGRGNDDTAPVMAIYRRGFVAEIRLTAAAFLGEVCAFCEGRGHFQSSGSYAECPRCRGPLGTGTGRTGGLAKELFSRHPIERVVLTDVRAICGARSNLYFTAIVDQNGFVAYPDQPPFPRKTYATAAECEADLSAALVAYGRRLAGLPPLPVKEDARV
jgi:uncharacterized protein (TIGR02996 family)